MKNLKKDGLALIVVLVLIVVFSSLILAVVISSTTAIRRAHYHKDKLVSLQIAHAGIQEVFYWLNYTGYDGWDIYPADGHYFFGTGWSGAEPSPTNPYNPTGITGGSCIVMFDYTGQTNSDTIIAVGKYRDRQSTVSVAIRGRNSVGVSLSQGEQGVAEAFNKKAIYAKIINSPVNTTVRGNITTTTPDLRPYYPIYLQEATWTETTGVDLPMLDTTLPSFQLRVEPTVYEAYFFVRESDDAVWTSSNEAGTDTHLYPQGVSYNAANRTFTFTDTQIDYNFYVIGNGDANADFNHANNRVSRYVRAANNIRLSADITTDTGRQSVFHPGDSGTFLVSNLVGEIRGDLAVKKPLDLNSNITVNGSIVSNSDITINGPMAYLDATDSGYGAGILIVADLGDTSGKTFTANGSAHLIIRSPGRFGMINWSGTDDDSDPGLVNINTKFEGSVYSYGNIELGTNTEIDTGLLVAGNRVLLNGGYLHYNSKFYNNPESGEIFEGFSGGRRRYLPVPASWRIDW